MSNFRIANETDRAVAVKALNALDVTKPWFITIKRETKKRSLNANSFYFVIVELIAKETGNSIDDTHEALKGMFCPMREVRVGDRVEHVRSTAKLEVADFSAYLDAVIAFATSQLGIILPAREHYDAA